VTEAPSLSEALGIARGDVVAFTGGGGKTTAVLHLARELGGAGWRVLASTTTKVGATMASEMPVVLCRDGCVESAVRAALDGASAVFLAAGRAADGKFEGAPPDVLDALALAGVADVVLVEADGARQRPLKAPAEHEPVIPAKTTIVSFMMGIDALGGRLDGPMVHRPELVRNFGPGPLVTMELMASIAASERGGLKGVPKGAAARPVINKASESSRSDALAVAAAITERGCPSIDRTVVADIRSGIFSVVTGRD
jgi:probable selenium-dependent hydroxylase accessory protein YqeC